MRFAEVTTILTNRVKLTFDDGVESNMPYCYLASYTPTLGDRVAVDTKVNLVLGKVVI